MTIEKIVTSPEETMTIGQKLAPFLQAKDIILLDGDLGAGKTTFTKGLALGLGIKRNVKSPTFTIIREYQEGRLPLYHMDVYRLEEGGGDELGLDEYFNGDGVSVVEWSQFVESELPEDYLRIAFHRQDETGEEQRKMTFLPKGKRFETIVKKLEAQLNDK
ncbi:tRNA (adenosine(37)-N6)-threonylcarbamoyltransferase complex ATPase subunit type 1 TsaE [Secundilactobacillus collinoides]|nr:tRNA (adenosine(37)-N6)-threonylcarbamoyltransferase complex ATPase subunit type 1 TsaE [Secundilactobacillus collinoides]KZL39191.1 ATP/GTP hydrolase [Secundilactobacillus collinoides]